MYGQIWYITEYKQAAPGRGPRPLDVSKERCRGLGLHANSPFTWGRQLQRNELDRKEMKKMWPLWRSSPLWGQMVPKHFPNCATPSGPHGWMLVASVIKRLFSSGVSQRRKGRPQTHPASLSSELSSSRPPIGAYCTERAVQTGVDCSKFAERRTLH